MYLMNVVPKKAVAHLIAHGIMTLSLKPVFAPRKCICFLMGNLAV